MLDDLLDLSRIEAGKLTLRSTEISPAVLLSEAIGIFAPRAAAKQVALRSTLQPEVPAFVLGDPLRLHQILWNFLSNAIKFTERGEVVLDVRVRDTRPDPPRVELEFTVSDTGIGIPPERMQDVFLPFVQADDSIQLRFGGTGLGLAIAQRLAQLMGGRIWAESQVGQGTVMHFVAPFEVA
jgi:signal transduction histidine kinase